MAYYNAQLIKRAYEAPLTVELELPKWVNRVPTTYKAYNNCDIVGTADSPARPKSHYRLQIRVTDIDKNFLLMRSEDVPGPHGSVEHEQYVVGPYKVGETGGVVYAG